VRVVKQIKMAEVFKRLSIMVQTMSFLEKCRKVAKRLEKKVRREKHIGHYDFGAVTTHMTVAEMKLSMRLREMKMTDRLVIDRQEIVLNT
jgi:hypothetical protein